MGERFLPLVELRGIKKNFGTVRALAGVDLRIDPGELLGIVGHNGAGKSTLMGVLRGTIRRTAGSISIDGADVADEYSVRRAYELGIRCVFQETSLCLTLKVFENARLIHRDLKGFGWAKRARRLIGDMLDEIFPGHGIDVDSVTGDLPAAQRQMVEIARAFTVVSAPVRLIILDEPTSALDASIAAQLLHFVQRAAERGQSCVLISHRLKEIIGNTMRVIVMRDGAVVGEEPSAGLHEEMLVEKMGVMAQTQERPTHRDSAQQLGGGSAVGASAAGSASKGGLPADFGTLRVEVEPVHGSKIKLMARAGEVIGLAGLDAHGQRATLLRTFNAAYATEHGASVRGNVAYVSGDRHREGVFSLWSVGHNLTIGMLRQISRWGLIHPQAEDRLAGQWRDRLSIKTPTVKAPIMSLSGGNQQKVLIARALCSGADIVLLDDPMRGVDVSSKREMFEQIRREAAGGKCFLLYTTESEELNYCDRIYVFYRGDITEEIARKDLTEDRVLRASFADPDQVAPVGVASAGVASVDSAKIARQS